MPKKRMSDKYTQQEFLRARAAIGLPYGDLATELTVALRRKKPVSVALLQAYACGQAGVTYEMERALDHLVGKAALRCNLAGQSYDKQTAALIAYNNARPDSTPRHPTEGRLMRRLSPAGRDQTLMPPHQLGPKGVLYVGVLRTALKYHAKHIGTLARKYMTPEDQTSYRLEMEDVAYIMRNLPASLPYDLCLRVRDWDVVMRALRNWTRSPDGRPAGESLRRLLMRWKNQDTRTPARQQQDPAPKSNDAYQVGGEELRNLRRLVSTIPGLQIIEK